MNKTPIEQWHSLIHSDLVEPDLTDGLRKIYNEVYPTLAELIVESYCPAACQHCIYPSDYHKYNEVLTGQQWKQILSRLYVDLGFRTYIFGGRYLTKKIIDSASFLKNNFSEAEVGIIADCRHLEPLLGDIVKLEPDWIDISIDGLGGDHDLQRKHPGAFDQALRISHELRKYSSVPKINILPCLTTVNLASVVEMIAFLNAEGFKNFFVSPVTIVKNFRPDQDLAPSNEDFVYFIDRLLAKSAVLVDSWVELNIYDVRYYCAIRQLRPELFSSFFFENDHLEYVNVIGDNELHINYFPMSLTGINELIINSNGDIIPPKIIATGKIEDNMIFANILKPDSSDGYFLKNLTRKKALSFYLAEFLQEKGKLTTNLL